MKVVQDAVYWLSPVGPRDDFGIPIANEIIDAPTHSGQWALMTPQSWRMHGRSNRLGTGLGQRFVKQSDGRWLKVEG